MASLAGKLAFVTGEKFIIFPWKTQCPGKKMVINKCLVFRRRKWYWEGDL